MTKKQIIKELKKKRDTLRCTEEDLGYHCKECDGVCEKVTYDKIIKWLEAN